MKRTVVLLAVIAGLAATPSAHAAKRTCISGGAHTIMLEGKVSIVSLDTKEATTFYGCWVPSGKRFKLGTADDWDESLWDIVDGRYIGVYRFTSGGEGDLSADARTWACRTRRLGRRSSNGREPDEACRLIRARDLPPGAAGCAPQS